MKTDVFVIFQVLISNFSSIAHLRKINLKARVERVKNVPITLTT